MPFFDLGKNRMLDFMSSAATFMALFSTVPSTIAGNEISGGSYARVAATWDAASSGQAFLSSNVTFNVPGGSSVSHVGILGTSTGTTIWGYMDVTDETFGGDGTYTINSTGTYLQISDTA
jgi:hypothetical protein